MRKLVYISALLTILMASCQGQNEKTVGDGKEFYTDACNTVHSYMDCPAILGGSVNPLGKEPMGSFCTRCMNDTLIRKAEELYHSRCR